MVTNPLPWFRVAGTASQAVTVSVLVSVASVSRDIRSRPKAYAPAGDLLRWVVHGLCRTYSDQDRTSRNA
jgi:hypothetical protein